jgi:hypothetical protein
MKLTIPKTPTLPSVADIKKHRSSMVASLVVAAAMLVIYFIWLDPLLTKKDDLEAKLKQQRDMIHKYEQKLNQSQSIQENLSKQEQDLKESKKKLFHGSDPYQLAASLGSLLSSKDAGAKRMDVQTYQVLASKDHGLYQEVHLRFNLMTTVDGLQYFLSRINNSEFAILVQEINIQKVQRNKGPDLVVDVILAALMEKTEKS